MARTARQFETSDHIKMIDRSITATGRKVGAADPHHLGELAALQASLDAALREAVTLQREAGASWQQIADGLGISQPAAIKRFRNAERPGLRVAGGQTSDLR